MRDETSMKHKMTNKEAFAFLESRGAPFRKMFGAPFLVVLLASLGIPFLVPESSVLGRALQGLVESNAYFAPIAADAANVTYPQPRFFVQMSVIYITGPLLTIWILVAAWKNNHILDVKVFSSRLATCLLRIGAWLLVLLGALGHVYYNNPRTGACAGCEYKSFLLVSCTKTLAFVIISWAMLQIIANFKSIGDR